GLARAAMALDSGECARIMSGSIARRGVVATWDDVVRPVLQSVGSKWERTDQGVEVEHALSHSVIAVFAHAGEMMTKPVNSRPVILACTTEEQHSLPLYAIYAALAERNIAARVLGARVPAASLATSIERTGPAAVIVWSQLTDSADLGYLESLPKTRPPVTVIAAGPGWRETGTGSFAHVGDLSETVMRVQEALHLV
ncbi:MAG: MerR family transcriptional regulator, partial [Actinobacteria bacterium]|nr:MerR family transcriptional regulator [Actinomycetota bacterium]